MREARIDLEVLAEVISLASFFFSATSELSKRDCSFFKIFVNSCVKFGDPVHVESGSFSLKLIVLFILSFG